MPGFLEESRDALRSLASEAERAFLNPEWRMGSPVALPENVFLKDGARDAGDPSRSFRLNEAVEINGVDREGQMNENRKNGERREREELDGVKKQYPESEGYKVGSEECLRDKDGIIVKDPVTGEKRIVDITVSKDGQVVKMIEVTSPTAPKESQTAKEERIRAAGGDYIKDKDTGELKKIADDVKTEIHRRD